MPYWIIFKHNPKSFLSQTTHLFQWFFCSKGMTKEYSLTSPYGHLCNTDTWFCPFGVRIKDVCLYNIGKQHQYEDVIFDKIHKTSDIGHRTSDIGHRTSPTRHWTTNKRHQTSDIRHQKSDKWHHTSYITRQTSDIRQLTLDIKH